MHTGNYLVLTVSENVRAAWLQAIMTALNWTFSSLEIVSEARSLFRGERIAHFSPPEKWDGMAAARIVSILERWFDEKFRPKPARQEQLK
jgi:hypothetical protein